MAQSKHLKPLLRAARPQVAPRATTRFLSTTTRNIQAPPHLARRTLTPTSAASSPSAKLLPRTSARTALAPADLQKTALFDLHKEHGAKMVPFAGFYMPLQYSDLSHAESHQWTREKASLFDVSHMVQHRMSGPGTEAFLMKITPSSLHTLPANTSTLSCLLDAETGGIIDDTIITRQGDESFYIVTNAGCRDTDLPFFQAELDAFHAANPDAKIDWKILTEDSLVALQGPAAAAALQKLITPPGPHYATNTAESTNLNTLFFGQSRSLHITLASGEVTPSPILISRTGYTGEDGFEIAIPDMGPGCPASAVVGTILSSSPDVKFAGLAARDSLRLEAGMCLYGHDLSTSQTPATATLGWIVGKDRRDPSSDLSAFNGSSVILPQLAKPSSMPERRVGIIVEKGAPAREGAEILDPKTGEVIGRVTSGLPSPSLGGVNIAMGYVKNGFHKKDTELGIKVRKTVRNAKIAKMPFVESKFFRGQAP